MRVDSIKGDFVVKPAKASDDPSRVGKVDTIILGVKAWQVPQAAQEIIPMVGEHTFVVPLQNGVDAPAQLVEILGAEHVMGGLCQISAFIAGVGHIRHVGIEPYIAFAELDNRPSQRAESLRKSFEKAGVKAEIPTDIHRAMWQKFLFIASISAVGALTRVPVGILRSLPETRHLLIDVMQEVVAVAQAHRVNLTLDSIDAKMAFIDSMPSDVIPSMQRDILEGRPSELDALVGAILRKGEEVNIPTPLSSLIYQSLSPQELRARGEITY